MALVIEIGAVIVVVIGGTQALWGVLSAVVIGEATESAAARSG